jgi:ribosomal protein S12 methylthiotransferase
MKRHITAEQTYELIDRIKATVPGIALRTTLIVGYPGETDEDFGQLMDFVQKVRFDRLGVFQYSHEEHTGAYLLEDDVPGRVKQDRADRIMMLQQEISNELNKAKEGKVFRTVIDRIEGDHYVGRTEYDSPEVDNEVLIPLDGQELQIGEFYNIRITKADFFDLYGEVAEGAKDTKK